jgi:hypothetical protein
MKKLEVSFLILVKLKMLTSTQMFSATKEGMRYGPPTLPALCTL